MGGDLNSAQFVYLYQLPVVKIETNTLATAIKASKETVDKTCGVELTWAGFEETRMFYVAHLSGCDMILGKLPLQDVRATISAGTATVTIQPTGMDRFPLRMWRGNRVTDLSDRYHNIRIDPDSEKHTTFLCHMGHYRSRVMQQGDCNAPPTMVRAMNEIFRDMIFKDLIIYIDDIIISSATYKEHVEALRRAL